MFPLGKATGALIVATFLLVSRETNAGQSAELELLTRLASDLKGIDLEERCMIYRRSLTEIYPVHERARLDTYQLFRRVLREAEQTFNTGRDDVRLMAADVKKCMTPSFTPTTADSSKTDVRDGGGQQRAQAGPDMFDYDEWFILSRVKYESNKKPQEERCRIFDGALRYIYSSKAPELASASPLAVLESAIAKLKRNGQKSQSVVELLRKCAEKPPMYGVDYEKMGLDAIAGPRQGARPNGGDAEDSEILTVKNGLKTTGQNLYEKPATTSSSSSADSEGQCRDVSEIRQRFREIMLECEKLHRDLEAQKTSWKPESQDPLEQKRNQKVKSLCTRMNEFDGWLTNQFTTKVGVEIAQIVKKATRKQEASFPEWTFGNGK